MTPTTTSGAAIQRYKIGYHSDEWGQRSSTPSGIPDASGSWVRYADHVTALAAGQATAAQAVAEPADTVVLNAAMRAIQQAIELIGAPTDERMRAVRRVLRGAVVVAEDSGVEVAAPAAPAQPAAQQGVAYAELPEKYYLAGGEVPTWDAKQMHAFADATHAIRASRGQAPVETEFPVSAQADSVQEDAARVFTYKNQPCNNVTAWRFGEACRAAQPGGDPIDHGLSLLQKLQERGYGIVAIDATRKQGATP